MTYHGNPYDSVQNTIERAKGKADVRIRRAKYGFRFKRVHNQKAYDAGKEFNREHGIECHKIRDPALNAILRLAGDPYRSKVYAKAHPVTLANMAEPDMKQKQPAYVDEYAEAEDRMRERCKRAVDMLVFGMEEISQVGSTPDDNSRRTINQGFMVDTIYRLCSYAKIPIPDLSSKQHKQKLQNKKCTNCGCKIYDTDNDMCVDCSINIDVDELQLIGKDRREREQAEKEIRRLQKSINKIEKKMRGENVDDN